MRSLSIPKPYEKMAIAAAELFREADNPINPNPVAKNLVWENLGLQDEAAVGSSSVFGLGSGLTTTVDWDIEKVGGRFEPKGGNDFVSYINMGSRAISSVDIFYGSADDASANPSAQNIGFSDLNWTGISSNGSAF